MAEIDKAPPGGVPLHVRKAGEAGNPCLVLLHGWPQTSLAWAGILPEHSAEATGRLPPVSTKF